jgi:hypothetical protein
MGEKGKYIYGIINSNINESFGSCGRAIKEPVFPLGSSDVETSQRSSEEVYSISYQDISAVVRNSEIDDYKYMLKDALARLLVRHQIVIEKIMSLGYTIIPMRLGTFAQDETETKDILKKGYDLIKDMIQKIRDKIEIDVVSTWSDFASVLKEVGEEKEIKELKEKLLTSSKGITVDDQMKVGIMLKKALDSKKEEYAFKIHSALKNISQNIRIHELMNDEMVINSAFLIDKVKQKEFDREIENLNSEFGEKLNFRCVGPLPPYSFYTLEIKKMQLKDVDWARKKLRILDDFTTEYEIKKSYQRSAFCSHPDKNPDTPGIEKEFDEINNAYKILVDYCKACKQGGQIEGCSFEEQEFKKNSILVKVRE